MLFTLRKIIKIAWDLSSSIVLVFTSLFTLIFTYFLLGDLFKLLCLNKAIALYLSSTLMLILLFIISSEKVNDFMIRKVQEKGQIFIIESKDGTKKVEITSHVIFSTILIIPKKTIIYIFYIGILICGHIDALSQINNRNYPLT